MSMDINSIKKNFENNKPIIILDKSREVEGDLIFPSEIINSEVINFMISKGKGLLCTVADEKLLIERGFFKLPSNNLDKHNTNYFIPIDYKLSNTGISSFERAKTIEMLAQNNNINLFSYPGHVQLLGGIGINNRKGHTEASLELVEFIGYKRFSTIIEILDENGDSHNFEYINQLSKEYDIPIIDIEDIYIESMKRKQFVFKVSEAKLPTELGVFKIVGFKNLLDNKEHFLIYSGDIFDGDPVKVRVHSECVTGDVLKSKKCDCGSQLYNAMNEIKQRGILIYLRQEGRNIGITNKIKAYALQDDGVDTYDANEIIGLPPDGRDYAIAAQMLKAMNINDIILLSNNEDKKNQLMKYGINVKKMEKLFGKLTVENKFYLKTKMERFNHKLNEFLK
ncbi:riboflavin biosynthesis protein RibBA [Tepiditoga spiralis]|uniref:GTP cyclohydrolase-2 n=1 Tax=Tepiditoga spiralis TaxID=2108365 RepID=A0A7G1G7Z6_9BACT|nr:bifunctional 3,4-dihydroxy-2-butanone-4-phosphate synthase/GTP cyclohydrolase II [Tepiditoga spiralis]BBE31516.1 riboflavin biosynthesis protein RibBA [Tepiditoga spiralis]